MQKDLFEYLQSIGESQLVETEEYNNVAVDYFFNCGVDKKRSVLLARNLVSYWNFDVFGPERKIWALRNGFLPDKLTIFNLNENNKNDYLSDIDYHRLHPLNNHFAFWINDKLTLKYMLQKPIYVGKTFGGDVMPEYYLYIENDGHYTYLMDAPTTINHDEDFILNLLKQKGILALKPNNGSCGRGFIKLEYYDGKMLLNKTLISQDDWNLEKQALNGYIVTEYIKQHQEFAKISPNSVATLRIIAYRDIENKYKESKPKVCVSYVRFGTKISGSACNLGSGGIGVPFDFETGEYYGHIVRYQKFIGTNESYCLNKHPDNGYVFKGKKLPHWQSVKQVVYVICNFLSSLEYFGFDIVITDDGVKICEINSLPSLDYEQVMFGPILKDKDFAAFIKKKLNKKDGDE